MHKSILVAVVACLALAACHQKPDESAAPTETVATAADQPAANAPSSAAAEPTPDQLEHAKKQAALDYATMEDSYLNDPHGQWAKEATATSTFGESSNSVNEVNKPRNIAGKPDGAYWTNDHQDMGFDSFEGAFEKPVHATEVRAVFGGGISTVTKVELKDTDGKYTTVWTGINEDPPEKRGPRHWFVRKFAPSAAAIVGVKITIANSVDRGYKTVDALQLVGE
jgi:hypothetical protein